MNPTDKVTILLVDDNPAKLLTYEAILASLGERLMKADSAREALESLLNHEIAVVLIDVCMPELDGYELAGMIREHPRCRKTSIIFVSAVLMTDLDRLHGYECGAVDYVPVPVVPEILRAKVSVFAELYRKTEQLEKLNRDLERRVSERTAALEATTAELRENDRRKDEFLAMLAHELRGPLAPLRASLQLLRPGMLPPAKRVAHAEHHRASGESPGRSDRRSAERFAVVAWPDFPEQGPCRSRRCHCGRRRAEPRRSLTSRAMT